MEKKMEATIFMGWISRNYYKDLLVQGLALKVQR